MTKPHAYDEITLSYGGNTVAMRPSLRAAIQLEKLHGGFPALLRKVEEFDTATIHTIITAAAGREAAKPILAHAATRSLKSFKIAAQGPCIALIAAFFPATPDTQDDQPTTEPTPWADLFAELYGFATGWIGWTPDTAWNATPQEITDAFTAHIVKLKAIHGGDDDGQEKPTGTSEKQRRENEARGLDPDFDRSGLNALKSMTQMREGQPL